jgi:hypothetical protein
VLSAVGTEGNFYTALHTHRAQKVIHPHHPRGPVVCWIFLFFPAQTHIARARRQKNARRPALSTRTQHLPRQVPSLNVTLRPFLFFLSFFSFLFTAAVFQTTPRQSTTHLRLLECLFLSSIPFTAISHKNIYRPKTGGKEPGALV